MARVLKAVATPLRRILATGVLIIGMISVIPMFAGIASAHHPEITASVDCTATVSFTSTAWAGDGTAASRRNADIAVTLQIVSGTGTVPAAVHGAYTTANNYQFTGTFAWPAGANSIKLTATAIAKWGNNNPAGDSRTTPVIVKPTNCGGTPGVATSQSCTDGAGTVVFTFTNTATSPFAGAVTYTIPAFSGMAAQTFTVDKGATVTKTYTDVADGAYTLLITSGVSPNVTPQTQTFTVACDRPGQPVVEVAQTCAAYDGTAIITLKNVGGQLPLTFLVQGTPYVVPAAGQVVVEITGLPDGPNTIEITQDGVHFDQLVTVSCDPTVGAAAVCNTVDTSGAASLYWFTIANTESNPLDLTWNGGGATVPAGGSTLVSTTTAPLSVHYQGVEIASAAAAGSACTRDVVFTKELVGQPPTGETYTIRVSRLVGATYVEQLTFDLQAGVPTTITLPSTLDPAGLVYKVEEVNAGTASTTSVTPDQLTLSGNLGETVSVVVTNGYASVDIVKQTLTTSVNPGGQVVYTLQATNTGGLTLDPVVILDRLPSQASLVSVSVTDDAGVCALAETGRPQLVVCTMNDPLPAGGRTALITITVKVDGTVTNGTSVLNQAKVVGAYTDGAVLAPETPGSALSCLPLNPGTVCDLSATIGVPVSEVDQESPTTTVARPVVLPATGGTPTSTLAIAAGLVAAGALLAITRRRRPIR